MALSNFACGCSLKTGCLIIGWICLIARASWLALLIWNVTFLQNEYKPDSDLVIPPDFVKDLGASPNKMRVFPTDSEISPAELPDEDLSDSQGMEFHIIGVIDNGPVETVPLQIEISHDYDDGDDHDNPLDFLFNNDHDHFDELEKQILGIHRQMNKDFDKTFGDTDKFFNEMDKMTENFQKSAMDKSSDDGINKYFDEIEKSFDEMEKNLSSFLVNPQPVSIIKDDGSSKSEGKVMTFEEFLNSLTRHKRDIGDFTNYETRGGKTKMIKPDSPAFIFDVVITCITILTSLLLIVGAERGSRKLFIPWMLNSSFVIIVDMGRFIFCTENYFNNETKISNVFADLFFIGIDMYILLVVYSHYKELKGLNLKESSFFTNNEAWSTSPVTVLPVVSEKELEANKGKENEYV